VGELVTVRSVPVDRPGHNAADGPVGRLGGERAAGPAFLEAVEGVDDTLGLQVPAAGGVGGGGQAEADLFGFQVHLELDAGECGHEVRGALLVHRAVAALHR